MLKRNYSVGEKVSVKTLGFDDSVGVIVEVGSYPNGEPFYKVRWNDGTFNDHRWDASTLFPA